MAINIYQQWNLRSKINEQAEQKQTHRCRERFDGCQRGGGLGMGGKGEVIKKVQVVCYRIVTGM